MTTEFYSSGNRDLQDQFESRALADRLEKVVVHHTLGDRDRAFIGARDMLFISTVNEDGHPTVSYKGGAVGFIKIVDDTTLAIPGYDGNGMFLTAGNISKDERVGLLLIDFENPMRLRIQGRASVSADDPLMSEYKEAKYITRISIDSIFINCPRYVHRYVKADASEFVPQGGCETPEPEWKENELFKDVLPNKDKD